jgi:hypothetical protein
MRLGYELACKLGAILQAEAAQDYDYRNLLTHEAIALALRMNLNAGIRIDMAEPDWPVAYIELPQGQITYHLACHDVAWDGHTTEEKNQRIRQFIDAVSLSKG